MNTNQRQGKGRPYDHDRSRAYYSDHHPVVFRFNKPEEDDDWTGPRGISCCKPAPSSMDSPRRLISSAWNEEIGQFEHFLRYRDLTKDGLDGVFIPCFAFVR